MYKLKLIKADITTLRVDAIVNAANNSLTGGGGVDGAIHRVGGKELTEYCKSLKGCKTGYSKITPGFLLPCKFVIHTVGPVWNNGTQNEAELLTSCYKTSLQLAVENQIKSMAFPSISTGAYRFPLELATEIALKSINEFENLNDIEAISLVAFDEKTLTRMKNVANKLGFN